MNIRKLKPVLFLVLALGVGVAWADDMEEGYQALDKGDYEKALNLFDRQAQKGNRYARYNLGVMYLEGLGVEPNPAIAYVMFKQAARQGDQLAGQSAAILFRSLTPAQMMEIRSLMEKMDKKQP